MMRYWAPKSISVATWAHPNGLWKMTAQPSQKLTARQTPGMVQLQERFFVKSHLVARRFFCSELFVFFILFFFALPFTFAQIVFLHSSIQRNYYVLRCDLLVIFKF